MTATHQEPGPPRRGPETGTKSAAPAAHDSTAGAPIVPEQSPEDTDAGWGEYGFRDDDRLHRDRPPHWEDV